MDFADAVFTLQMLFFVAVFFWQLNNLLSLGKYYSLKADFVFFILGTIFFGIGMITSLLSLGDNLFISQLFKLEVLLYFVFGICFVALILLELGAFSIKKANELKGE
jgi:hypothetical protein